MGEDDSQLKDNRIRRAVPKYVVGAEKGLTLVFFRGIPWLMTCKLWYASAKIRLWICTTVSFGDFHKWVSQNGWFISWNILLKWMISRGTPILGNHHILIICIGGKICSWKSQSFAGQRPDPPKPLMFHGLRSPIYITVSKRTWGAKARSIITYIYILWASNHRFVLVCLREIYRKPYCFSLDIAIENCPFIVDLPIKNCDFP